MIQKLGNIAGIQTGAFAKPGKTGEVVYLQVKHFDENGNLISKLHPDLFYSNVSIKHLLLPGDVLFAAKGIKNFAAVYEVHNPPAVASTSFFVIRLRDETVLPEFLAWFMNHPDTQAFLKANAYGTAMASISKAFLIEMEVPIPSLQVQQQILIISGLREREKGLILEIDSLREIFTSRKLLKIAWK